MQPGVRADLRTLFETLSASRKRQLLLVLLLMPVAALAEMLMVGAVVPFLALLAGRTGLAFSVPVVPDLCKSSQSCSP